jgi:hypothetical protein
VPRSERGSARRTRTRCPCRGSPRARPWARAPRGRKRRGASVRAAPRTPRSRTCDAGNALRRAAGGEHPRPRADMPGIVPWRLCGLQQGKTASGSGWWGGTTVRRPSSLRGRRPRRAAARGSSHPPCPRATTLELGFSRNGRPRWQSRGHIRVGAHNPANDHFPAASGLPSQARRLAVASADLARYTSQMNSTKASNGPPGSDSYEVRSVSCGSASTTTRFCLSRGIPDVARESEHVIQAQVHAAMSKTGRAKVRIADATSHGCDFISGRSPERRCPLQPARRSLVRETQNLVSLGALLSRSGRRK